jgi:branched-chain amino acid transport system substrate-binding protein
MDTKIFRHKALAAFGFAVALLSTPLTASAQGKPIKVGVVTFLSGPAAGPFGVPAKNAAEMVVELLNAGKAPAPYDKKGFGGNPIEITLIDEAGGTTKQVQEYRNLVQRQEVDLVIGYISSGDCLAIAPVAEELKKLTVLFDCGTPRVFEDASYKYVFRTGAHATMDAVGAAMYTLEKYPNLKNYAGLNQNYAWGQDSWADWDAAMKTLKPGIQVTTSQMPKLGAGQYNAEITTLLESNSEVIHTSFWGGDLESFLLQAAPRELFKKSVMVIIPGEHVLDRMGAQLPEGAIVGARGTHGPFAPDTELNRWLRKNYTDRYNQAPIYAAYKITQAFLGVKTAYEKAQAAAGGKAPDQEQIIAAFENLQWEGPSGKVKLALGKGHQAIQDTAYGTIKKNGRKATLVDIKYYPADKVNPPDGIKSVDWIKAGFKKP